MTLTLVSAEDTYVVFEDADGDEIISTPLPIITNLFHWEDYDLSSAWWSAVTKYREQGGHCYAKPPRGEFIAAVRREIADMTSVPEIVWCEACEEPTDEDNTVSVQGGTHACQSCYEDNYRSCDDCGGIVHHDSTYYTLSDESVCTRCCDRYYLYCDDCDGYYRDSYSDEHQHGGCDCEPPTFEVRMPNGDEILTADERIAVSLPAGVISDEGMHSIARLIREHAHTVSDGTDEGYELRSKWWMFSHEVKSMDSRWQTKEGNFTKRLSKLAHKSSGLKVPADLLTKIGNVARDNSGGSEIRVELTRQLNLSAADFYHEDSCWWQSYSESRCSLKNNGGIGMRTFAGVSDGIVQGRAWIMPMMTDANGNLTPTFDATKASAYVVFNGYGDLSGYIPARVVAGMTGMTYRKISFTCSPMYVNSESGYLVSSEEIIARYATDGLHLDTDQHSSLYYRETAAATLATLTDNLACV